MLNESKCERAAVCVSAVRRAAQQAWSRESAVRCSEFLCSPRWDSVSGAVVELYNVNQVQGGAAEGVDSVCFAGCLRKEWL